MKFIRITLGLLLFCALGAQAQIKVEVITDQDQFLPGESLRIGVRITNHSGNTLVFGDTPDWIKITVDAHDGKVVPIMADLPILGKFEVETATRVTRRFDLVPYFNITRPGGYSIVATVRAPNWSAEVRSAPKAIDIMSGTKSWEQAFGVPAKPGNTNAPEVRRYALLQALHLKNIKLYVRVSDSKDERVYGTFPLGPLLSFSSPEPVVDKASRLHVLYQYGARSFYYSVIDPDGKLVLRQTYDYAGTRPRLRTDDSGNVLVWGGVRAPRESDYSISTPATNAPAAAGPADAKPATTEPVPAEPKK